MRPLQPEAVLALFAFFAFIDQRFAALGASCDARALSGVTAGKRRMKAVPAPGAQAPEDALRTDLSVGQDSMCFGPGLEETVDGGEVAIDPHGLVEVIEESQVAHVARPQGSRHRHPARACLTNREAEGGSAGFCCQVPANPALRG